MRRLVSRATTASRVRRGTEDGMTTAEYAVGTVATCGFAGVLYKILTSTPIVSLVQSVLTHALHALF
jgi:hypothetical protein